MILASLAACGAPPAVAPATLDSDAVEVRSDLPNVVMITVDAVRADRIGAWGYAAATTPNIDKLAAQGRLYRQAWSPSPLTIPAHAALLTGRYPPRLGIRADGDSKLGPEAITLAEILHEAGYETGAATSAFLTGRQWGFDQGFDAFDDEATDATADVWRAERPGGVTVDAALEWKGKEHARPLFLWVHLNDAHHPYAPPSPFRERHPDQPYDGEVAYVDHQIGRLIDAFSGNPTVFVVAGDHGEGLGDHGELNHGLYAYPSTQHVPLVIAGAGVTPQRVEQATSLVDVLPTLLGLIGVNPPRDIDGKASPGEPRAVYVETFQARDRFGLAPQVGVIDGTDELLDVPDSELFDVVADPLGQRNRARTEPERVIALRKKLLAFGLPVAPAPTVGEGSLAAPEGVFDGDLSASLPDAKPARKWLLESQDAERLRAEGRLAEAATLLGRLSKAHPKVLEFQSRRATVLFDLDDVAAAEPVMVGVLERDPKNPAMRAAKASLIARRGQLGVAATLFEELATEQPFSSQYRTLAVAALLADPESADAGVKRGEDYLRQYPTDAGVAGVLGVYLYRAGQFERAVPLLIAGSKAPRPPPQVCFAMASLERGRDNKKGALLLLAREFELYPRNRSAGLALLEEASEQRDWVRTAETASRLIELDPINRAVWHARAQGLFNQGSYPDARVALEAGRKNFPESADLWMLDANLLAKEGHPDLAQRSFEKATELRKNEAEVPPTVVAEPDLSRPWEADQRPGSPFGR